ncbi:LacI family DNA-binding transcriptional regulator [Cellulomonas sp. KRMCY2]|uniref:LacI family DNA-binding transcriptional regulator n=1 Tax=Cellulomonas sp. KRMCY2 TaxID=1304865 RepID=UPI00045EA86A|nr:LacI family DNA-binding transcriptional regulator [Cellulomonas sp. KRMCY2]
MGGKAANIRDVARAAGVSHQTVSRVINNHPNISAATRLRVEASMERLHYRPSRVAQALANGRSGTIGIVSTDNGRYGPPKTQRAIETAARDAGYFVSTVNLASIGHEPMQDALGHLVDQGIDGLVLIAPQAAMLDSFDEFSLKLPFVTVDSAGRGGRRTVAIDQAEGARLATRHLVGLGHRRIMHISGPSDWLDSQARVQGWRTVMAQAGLPAPEPVVGDWSPRFGHDLAIELARHLDVTAVFVSNDQMALGLLQGLHRSGVRVPADLSVVGFDDIPEAEFFWPALTTVRPDFSALGRRCVSLLLDQLTGNELPPELPIPPTLTVRESTAPPRA